MPACCRLRRGSTLARCQYGGCMLAAACPLHVPARNASPRFALGVRPLLSHRPQSLHLEGPVNWHGDNSTFSAAPLAALPRLHSLSLACFYDYELR